MNVPSTNTPGILDNTPSVGETPQVFHCAACGECCHSWNLLIEEAKAKSLLEKPWAQERLSQYNVRLDPVKGYASPDGERFYLLPHRPNQTCVFLEENGRCEIHRREGLELKPNDCQRYPFAEVTLPQEQSVRYDVSASCKVVAEDMLLSPMAITPIDPELPKSSDGGGPDLPRQVPIHHQHPLMQKAPWRSSRAPIPWEEFTPAMERWGAYFYDTLGGPLTKLQGFHCAWRRSSLGIYENPPQGHHDAPATIPLELSHHLWGDRWLTPWLLRTPYGSFSRVQYLLGKPFGDPKIFGPEPAIDWTKTLHLRLPEDSISIRRFKGYAFHILHRVKPLSFGHSIESMTALAIASIFLVRWYARVLSGLNEETEVRPDTLVTAIRLVERYYTGHQPLFLERFRTDGLLRFLCYKALDQMPL